MSSKALSVTVNGDIFGQFEQAYRQEGMKKSHAVEEAIKLWLKAHNDALMAEGCRKQRGDGLAWAKVSKKRAAKFLIKE
ncbi:hypothetical protein HYR54_10905 [Candidatus Acetothermia bacterium]|nr:hypothetical protein [Candidatus Acetothermia bacterium]